jgi:HAD superfamily hydrolase (TIGR01459 family)
VNAWHFVDGIAALTDRYRGFVLDQWGVLHDGRQAYPGACETVRELGRRGKRLVVLSNSGRRATNSWRRLESLGFDPADFERVVTSGEIAWRMLAEPGRLPFAGPGRRCFLLTSENDRSFVEGLELTLVDTPEAADFVLAIGLDSASVTLDDCRALATALRRCGLPMICSNPDKVAVVPGGTGIAPGALAALYEEQGGEVLWIGKPHRPIYDACLALLGGLEPAEIVAIGDSLEHDIKGANGAGVASCLVQHGIHAAELRPGAAPAEQEEGLERLCRRYAARPDWVVPRLVL